MALSELNLRRYLRAHNAKVGPRERISEEDAFKDCSHWLRKLVLLNIKDIEAKMALLRSRNAANLPTRFGGFLTYCSTSIVCADLTDDDESREVFRKAYIEAFRLQQFSDWPEKPKVSDLLESFNTKVYLWCLECHAEEAAKQLRDEFVSHAVRLWDRNLLASRNCTWLLGYLELFEAIGPDSGAVSDAYATVIASLGRNKSDALKYVQAALKKLARSSKVNEPEDLISWDCSLLVAIEPGLEAHPEWSSEYSQFCLRPQKNRA